MGTKRGKVHFYTPEERAALVTEIDAILPAMRTDVILEYAPTNQRIIIDTKFTTILAKGWYSDATLKSGYLYQIYAYLRSQVDRGDSMADKALGMLLLPSAGDSVDETVVIQGHKIRFATVDLTAPAREIRSRLLALSEFTNVQTSAKQLLAGV